MLEKAFNWYIENQDELVKKYKGKFVVIVNNAIVGAYSSKSVAYFESEKKYELGTFLIQYCDSGSEAYSQSFQTRVAFA